MNLIVNSVLRWTQSCPRTGGVLHAAGSIPAFDLELRTLIAFQVFGGTKLLKCASQDGRVGEHGP